MRTQYRVSLGVLVALDKIMLTLSRGGELPKTRVHGPLFIMGSLAEGIILYRKYGQIGADEVRLVVLTLKLWGYSLASETRYDEAKNIWEGVFTDDGKAKASQSQKLPEKESGGEVEAQKG